MKLWIFNIISRLARWDLASTSRQANLCAINAALRVTAVTTTVQALLFFLFYMIGCAPFHVGHTIALSFAVTMVASLTISYVVCYAAGSRIIELREAKAKLREMSQVDALTGLLNRRAFLEKFGDRSGLASLVIFDIDRFKSINDRFGHGMGDAVIIAVASILREVYSQPPRNLVSRLGGEEFAVLSCADHFDGDVALAERVRTDVEARQFEHDGQIFGVTVSAGVAEVRPGASFNECFAPADKALYQAKQNGRNRVERALSPVG